MYQVEQDLITSRALVELFNRPLLAESLAFRGGTALFKLYPAAARYSEDIDLVQVRPGPIGLIMDTVQEQLNPWLGAPKRKQSEGRVTLTYRMDSEEGIPLRLKIEINSREHFLVLGYIRQPFSVKSRWFSGTTAIPTYQLDELLGTRLRALYQRKKGETCSISGQLSPQAMLNRSGLSPVSCATWSMKGTTSPGLSSNATFWTSSMTLVSWKISVHC